jgi:hypothetical protein
MSINFYSMGERCGYCVKAKQLLQNEINKGEVIELSASQAPQGVTGFPYFNNPANGLSHTGYPGDKQTLYNKLQYSGKVPQITQVTQNQMYNNQMYNNQNKNGSYGSYVSNETFMNPCDLKNNYFNNVNNACNNSFIKFPFFNGTTSQCNVNNNVNATPCPVDNFDVFKYICPKCNLPK